MSIVKRGIKGSKLTIQEMDDNLEYINRLNILDIYKQGNNLTFRKLDGNIDIDITPRLIDSQTYIKKIPLNKKNYYKGISYSNDSKIPLKYNIDIDNQLTIDFNNLKTYYLSANLGYWINNNYNTSTFNILMKETPGYNESYIVIGTGFSSNPNLITIQSDGKIIICGNFSSYNGVSADGIIRLNSDGSKDTNFNIITGFRNSVYSIEIQSDEKILVGGLFTTYNGVSTNYIIRLNSDGTRDTTFVIGTGFNGAVNSISIQSDGKILVGGQFTTYKGVTSNRIIRLNTDGSKDTSFVIGTGFNGNINSILIQSDGKILAGGGIQTYNGTTISNRIIRLNTDGSIDTSFNISNALFSGGGSVFGLKLQSDGKIILRTSFTSNSLIRLNPDGSRDTSFVIGTGFSTIVNSIVVQDDGKILVGGNFTTYNGVTSNYIIRLNTDGSQDTSFNIGTGFNGTVYSITIQSDGKILVGGNFTTYNGVTSNRIIKLNTNGDINSTTIRIITTTNYITKSDSNLITNLIEENNELKVELNGIIESSTLDYTLIEY